MKFLNAKQVKKAFEKTYMEIFKTRFYGLPIVNQHLSIKVVGLKETEDFYSFCLITPWMLNKIVVLKKKDKDTNIPDGMRVDQIEKLGEFFVTNVISPLSKFKDMERAIKAGERNAEQLFLKISCKENEQPVGIS